jgi:hypothetical protein
MIYSETLTSVLTKGMDDESKMEIFVALKLFMKEEESKNKRVIRQNPQLNCLQT